MDGINLATQTITFNNKKGEKRDPSATFESSDSVDCYARHSPTRWHSIHHYHMLRNNAKIFLNEKRKEKMQERNTKPRLLYNISILYQYLVLLRTFSA